MKLVNVLVWSKCEHFGLPVPCKKTFNNSEPIQRDEKTFEKWAIAHWRYFSKGVKVLKKISDFIRCL